MWRAVIYGNVQVLVRMSGVRCVHAHVGVVQFMSRAEVSGEVEGLFSAVVHMEMRKHEDNTVNFTSLCTVIVIKGTRGN